MAKNIAKETDKDSLWKSAQLKMGVVAVVFGLITTGYNFITKLTEKPPVNKELQADLEISYISMRSDIYISAGNNDSIPRNKQNFYLDYPVISNEISDKNLIGTDQLVQDDSVDITEKFVTCLMIQNKGKGDASEIELNLDRFLINNALKITENENTAHDYDSQIRAKATALKKTIKLPSRLSTGGGIIIPLFIRDAQLNSAGNGIQWRVISRAILLPDSIRFKDPSDTTPKTIKVRKMLNPIRISDGVEGRG